MINIQTNINQLLKGKEIKKDDTGALPAHLLHHPPHHHQ